MQKTGPLSDLAFPRYRHGAKCDMPIVAPTASPTSGLTIEKLNINKRVDREDDVIAEFHRDSTIFSPSGRLLEIEPSKPEVRRHRR